MLLAVLVTGLVSAFVLLETRIRPVLTGPDRRSGHTEIYVADSESVADGVALGEEVAVRVVNRTADPENYSWSLKIDGTPVHTGSMLLAPGESSVLVLGMPEQLDAALVAAECGTWVRAKRNDSWTRLAARHELGLAALLALNGATTDTFIGVGDRLCVAPTTTRASSAEGTAPGAAKCGTWARADRNDSWTRLAVRYELGLAALLALNGATADTFIGVGDRLCVAPPTTRVSSVGGLVAEFALAGKPQTLRWKVTRS